MPKGGFRWRCSTAPHSRHASECRYCGGRSLSCASSANHDRPFGRRSRPLPALLKLGRPYAFVLNQAPPAAKTTRMAEAIGAVSMLGDLADPVVTQRNDYQDAVRGPGRRHRVCTAGQGSRRGGAALAVGGPQDEGEMKMAGKSKRPSMINAMMTPEPIFRRYQHRSLYSEAESRCAAYQRLHPSRRV